jgi:hypothetical protein
MHALVAGFERVLSLSGDLQVTYPFAMWESIDRPAADLQGLTWHNPNTLTAVGPEITIQPVGTRRVAAGGAR